MEYRLEGDVLFVSGDLSDPLDTEFDRFSERLLELDAETLTLDLAHVDYMGSWYLGRIADLSMRANMEKKTLKVVAGESVGKLIRLSGLDKMIAFEQF